MRYYFYAIGLALSFCINSDAAAQMKSTCDPEGIPLLSTVPQTIGTLQMARILDSINRNANPEDFLVMNALRTEIFKKKLSTEKDPNKRVDLYFHYCIESLNAGNTDEAISVMR